ncbi:ATP-binding protein [Saccharothrix sp. S26]|uniref:ATP-binding protein n=1 Tax=Saccharothrix sp. S26 TaxID=2907215 RepID=UPI001F2A7764|nr:ATP-binding protein [Saccharothrix sp. S26]MCE6996144.1 ATP-binding protein [Saccharothrix sp. S26]
MHEQSWSTRGDTVDIALVRDIDEITLREVRRLVRDLLDGRDGVAVEDAVQVTDELVGNARRHGTPPRTCRLLLIDQGRRLRIEVDDTSVGQPRIRRPDTSGGRGMIIVGALATAWGVVRHPDHKTVWAELELDRPNGRSPHLAAAPNRDNRE